MSRVLSIVYPEWQGYGEGNDVHHSTLSLAERLLRAGNEPLSRDALRVEVPAEEALDEEEGVLGLASIAPRFARTLAAIQEHAPDRLMLIGGTCGTEVAPVAYLNERYGGDLAVLWLDAHADLNTPDSSPSGHFHGMVLRTLLGDGPAAYTDRIPRPLVPEQVALVGLRDTDPPETAYIEANDVSVVRSEALADDHRLLNLVHAKGYGHVYVHLDLDILNPDAFPDVLMQTPGGPMPDDVAASLRVLAGTVEVVGVSTVEFCARRAHAAQHLERLIREAGLLLRAG